MRQKLRWSGWFAGANVLIFLGMGLQYLFSTFPIDFYLVKPVIQTYAWFFIVVTYLGHFSLLAALAWLLILPFSLLPRWLFLPMAVVIFSACLVFMQLDVTVFTLYGSHLNKFYLYLLSDPETQHFLDLGRAEYFYIALRVFSFILLESLVAFAIWRFWLKKRVYRNAKPASFFLLSCLLLSYSITFLSFSITPRLAKQAIVLPLFQPIVSGLLTLAHSSVDLDTVGSQYIPIVPKYQGKLHYPQHPLQPSRVSASKNIIFIIIDSWRFNTVTKAIMPHTRKFADYSLEFQNHFAGANATGPGIFNLFYALPYTYWSAMLKYQQGPLLIKQLQAANYELSVFSSSTLKLPDFTKTTFIDIPYRKSHEDAALPIQADRAVTQDALTYLKTPPTRPFMAILYYNLAHSYCTDFDSPMPFQPIAECSRITYTNDTDPTPYLNRYLNAVHFIDNELASIYASLEKNHLLDNTIVILTGDHGQEFNDSYSNSWDHARHFTRYQIQTPLIIRWPGMNPGKIETLTSHYDLAPTLMRHILGINNPFSDYAIGQDLFATHTPDLLFVSGYLFHGWMHKDQIITWYQSGSVNIADLDGHPKTGVEVTTQSVQEVLRLVTQYYQEG